MFSKICDEWRSMMTDVDHILNKFIPQKDDTTQTFLQKLSQNKIQCESCSERFEENAILKHISKSKSCKSVYYNSEEYQSLKEKALKREKERLQTRYKLDKSRREFYDSYEQFLKSEKRLVGDQNLWIDQIKYIDQWKKLKYSNCAICRENIERLKQSGNLEVHEAMRNIEKVIHAKILELENHIDEVKAEVAGSVGHFEFDEKDHKAWKEDYKKDCFFIKDILLLLQYDICEEMEDLLVTVLQVLYDNAVKVGLKIKPCGIPGDKEFCEPKRITRDPDSIGYLTVPRNVILKIPNEYYTM